MLYMPMFSLLSVLVILQPRRSTLFPYTTLFRSPLTERILARGDATVDPVTFAPESDGEQLDLADRQARSEEHTSELQSRGHLVCRLLLEKKNHQPVRVPMPSTNTSTSFTPYSYR